MIGLNKFSVRLILSFLLFNQNLTGEFYTKSEHANTNPTVCLTKQVKNASGKFVLWKKMKRKTDRNKALLR